ncbi:MAG: PilX N-terminal domain-containing pilus assembly protein [Deltaproteobacteria bacterium]
MRGKNRLGNEKGVVLIIALLLLLVLTIIGISSISTTSFENIISGNERLSSTAFYASEAGIQVGLNKIPVTDPITIGQDVGPDTHYSGSVNPKGAAHSVGDDTGWSYRRYQVNANGWSLGASKDIEVQARYGPFPSGTGYNN